MNLAFGSTLLRLRKRIPWQYVSLATGLALVAAAAIHISALERANELPAGPPTSNAFVNSPFRRELDVPRPLRIVYIVASEQEAAALDALIAGELASKLTGDPPGTSISIAVIDRPDKEENYRALVHDQSLLGTYLVVDLRR
jgi:hypothetical protein